MMVFFQRSLALKFDLPARAQLSLADKAGEFASITNLVKRSKLNQFALMYAKCRGTLTRLPTLSPYAHQCMQFQKNSQKA